MAGYYVPISRGTTLRTHLGQLLLPPRQASSRRSKRPGRPVIDYSIPKRQSVALPALPLPVPVPRLVGITIVLRQKEQTRPSYARILVRNRQLYVLVLHICSHHPIRPPPAGVDGW